MLTTSYNSLLQCLDAAERNRLIALCERIPLQPQTCVCEPDDPVRHVYFPVEGFLVLQAQGIDTPGLEIAMVGREGMFDVLAALGAPRTPVRAVVQAQGWAWRLPVDVFQGQLATSPALERLTHRYAAMVMHQLTSLALCLRFHDVEARVAGWLLASQDRTGSNHCYITQESLSAKLGVRRVSVTTAACELQRRGAIEYLRGHLRVLDRAVLERSACSCYFGDRARYAEILGGSIAPEVGCMARAPGENDGSSPP